MAEETPPAETRIILAAALETVDPSNCKQHIEQRMSDLVDLLAMFPEAEIDPRAWSQIMVYAPKLLGITEPNVVTPATAEELDKILNSEGDEPITIHPDGSITPGAPAEAEQTAELLPPPAPAAEQ